MKKFIQVFSSIVLVYAFLLITSSQTFSFQPVKYGIDSIDSHISIFDNKKVGLVTNATGLNSSLESTIDILSKKVNLVAIFSPEHGVSGKFLNNEFVNDEIDSKTGLIVYSLFGKTKKPTTQMLENIDILVYDIQDVEARFYTYISTTKLCMEACKENDVTFLVLDRPNPLSCTVQGNILNENFKSFVGVSKITQRYGLTPGELAKYFNVEDNIGCKLFVIEMKNYKKDMYYDETGLNSWVRPSPAICSLNTAIIYPGTCIFEGTNVSEGRGTDKPFEYIGAPWIDSKVLTSKLNKLFLSGVIFNPISFTPTRFKFKDELCHGVFIEVVDRKSFNPLKAALALLYTIDELYPEKLELNHMLDLLMGDYLVTKKIIHLKKYFKS